MTVAFIIIIITALKGKYALAIIAVFIPVLAWWSAIRLARPTSPWARKHYTQNALERAQVRADRFDARWGPLRIAWLDFIGGTPNEPIGAELAGTTIPGK